MYLTRIRLNLSDAQARADFADPYQLHSTLARLMSRSDAEPPSRFLWRGELLGVDQFTVLLQSETPPNWDRIDQQFPAWACDKATKAFDLDRLATLQGPLRFRLRANPSVCRQGKRHGLFREEEQLQWLSRQAQAGGVDVTSTSVAEVKRLLGARRKGASANVVAHSVLFDGILRVVDAAAFAAMVRQGVGRAKHMGLGLLSVAPDR